MYIVQAWWAGHQLRFYDKIDSIEEAMERVEKIEADFRVKEIKCETGGMIMVPDVLCVSLLFQNKESKKKTILHPFNFKR